MSGKDEHMSMLAVNSPETVTVTARRSRDVGQACSILPTKWYILRCAYAGVTHQLCLVIEQKKQVGFGQPFKFDSVTT